MGTEKSLGFMEDNEVCGGESPVSQWKHHLSVLHQNYVEIHMIMCWGHGENMAGIVSLSRNCRRRKWEELRFRGQIPEKIMKENIGASFFSGFPVGAADAQTPTLLLQTQSISD